MISSEGRGRQDVKHHYANCNGLPKYFRGRTSAIKRTPCSSCRLYASPCLLGWYISFCRLRQSCVQITIKIFRLRDHTVSVRRLWNILPWAFCADPKPSTDHLRILIKFCNTGFACSRYNCYPYLSRCHDELSTYWPMYMCGCDALMADAGISSKSAIYSHSNALFSTHLRPQTNAERR